MREVSCIRHSTRRITSPIQIEKNPSARPTSGGGIRFALSHASHRREIRFRKRVRGLINLGNFPRKRRDDNPIARNLDCLFYKAEMNKRLGLDEKLEVLQASDTYRKWYSLDDQRVCILCEKPISGRMIDIWQDRDGTYMLYCPTPGCSGTPRDWFYCGFRAARRPRILQEQRTELQLQFQQMDSQRTQMPPRTQTVATNGQQNHGA